MGTPQPKPKVRAIQPAKLVLPNLCRAKISRMKAGLLEYR